MIAAETGNLDVLQKLHEHEKLLRNASDSVRKIKLTNVSFECQFNIKAELGNNSFTYSWVTSHSTRPKVYEVKIPDGTYDIDGINTVLQDTMRHNGTCLRKSGTNDYEYFIEFIADEFESRVDLEGFSIQIVTKNVPTSLEGFT